MSSILNSINEADIGCKVKAAVLDSMSSLLRDMDSIEKTRAADMLCEHTGKVILDLKHDPDPYGYHGFPLKYRLLYMGWPGGDCSDHSSV